MNGISGGDTTKQSVIHGVYTIRVGHNHITIRCKNGNIGKEITKYTGLARTIYIRYIYGTFGRKITKYTVHIYGAYIRFWPTLQIYSNYGASYDSGRPFILLMCTNTGTDSN
jgi:hypothetical protein